MRLCGAATEPVVLRKVIEMTKTNKTILLLCTVLLFVPIAAQSLDLTLGARVGLGHTGFYGPDYEKYKDRGGLTYARSALKLGFSGGLYTTLGFLPFLALQPEVLFSISGDTHRNEDTVRTANIHFLEIPVLVKARLTAGPGLASIFAGPTFDIKLGAGKLIVEDTDGGSKVETNLDAEDVNPFLLGVLFGGGYDLPLGPGTLSMDLRYKFGITEVHPDDFNSDNQVRESKVLLTIGYGITLYRSD